MSAMIEASGLGKQYGRSWALRDCTLSLPEGRVVALAGPNGAGKTTFLSLVMGLTGATAGTVTIDGIPAGHKGALPKVAFMGQDHPLYRRFSVEDHLRLGRSLNAAFDLRWARGRLRDLGIPLGRPAGRLSGGQQAQVALTLALAKRARVLLPTAWCCAAPPEHRPGTPGFPPAPLVLDRPVCSNRAHD
jgi:ABC-2 type transport system ATP-binding protein